MRFQKGQPRPENAGRKPGSKNKRTVAKVADKLGNNNVDPVQEILSIIPSLDPRDQVRAWFDLLSYCQAKPKEESEKETSDLSEEDLLLKFENVTDETLLKLVHLKNEAE